MTRSQHPSMSSSSSQREVLSVETVHIPERFSNGPVWMSEKLSQLDCTPDSQTENYLRVHYHDDDRVPGKNSGWRNAVSKGSPVEEGQRTGRTSSRHPLLTPLVHLRPPGRQSPHTDVFVWVRSRSEIGRRYVQFTYIISTGVGRGLVNVVYPWPVQVSLSIHQDYTSTQLLGTRGRLTIGSAPHIHTTPLDPRDNRKEVPDLKSLLKDTSRLHPKPVTTIFSVLFFTTLTGT